MGFGDFNIHFWGESLLQFLSLCCQLHTCPQKKKKIKNTTCIKTVIFASCGTFRGNSVPPSSFIMHFLLTCITIIKTTVLIACMLIINIDVYVDVTVLVKNCPLQVSILDSCVNGESRTSYWELHCGLSLTRLDKTQQIHPWLISQ